MLSRNLEKSLHRALACANERRHEYATLEHLLLSLTEDQDAIAVLRACGVDLERLRREVLNYVDNELANLVAAHSDDAKPTANFQRVLQRAAIHVQSSGHEEITGANVLVAMFAERESHAVYFLQEQDMTRFDAVNFISHGIAKAPGRSEIRRAQKGEEDNQGAGARLPFRIGRQMLVIDETKIIAAILCGQMIVEDAEADPVKKVVDIYERILAELLTRGHGSPSKREYEHIGEQALVDPLTGAFNRRYFDAHASRLAARCRAARDLQNPSARALVWLRPFRSSPRKNRYDVRSSTSIGRMAISDARGVLPGSPRTARCCARPGRGRWMWWLRWTSTQLLLMKCHGRRS